jgi:AraC-like DNA-binding protein
VAVEGVVGGYHELSPRPELRGYLSCAWSLNPPRQRRDWILPDGCMDIVWRPGIGLDLAGPDTGPVPVSRIPGRTVLGVRFLPGAAPALLGLPARALRDLRVPIAELWGPEAGRLEEQLAEAGSSRSRHELLQAELVRRLPDAEAPDRTVAGAVARLRTDPRARIDRLPDALAISERQLRRRFHSAVGYGPKMLARVLRLQRILALGRNRPDLAMLAIDAGYADQAHMTAECTRLTGMPPGRLLASRAELPLSA